jgi:UDP-glucose 4-epimerase
MSIKDRESVKECMSRTDVVLHTATLHKPHVVSHSRQDFIDTNITRTLTLLEEAVAAGVGSFIFTSTTSVYSNVVLDTNPNAPVTWVTEELHPKG